VSPCAAPRKWVRASAPDSPATRRRLGQPAGKAGPPRLRVEGFWAAGILAEAGAPVNKLNSKNPRNIGALHGEAGFARRAWQPEAGEQGRRRVVLDRAPPFSYNLSGVWGEDAPARAGWSLPPRGGRGKSELRTAGRLAKAGAGSAARPEPDSPDRRLVRATGRARATETKAGPSGPE
jgi:hypothetical protein